MRQQPRKMRWHFSASVLAPVVVALIITVAGVIGFLLWSTAKSDKLSLQRETQLAGHVLAEQLRAVVHAQEGVAMQDAAVVNTRINFNRKWVAENLGRWMWQYFGHDRTYVLNDLDQPIYTMDAGASADNRLYEVDSPTLVPLVQKMRAIIFEGKLEAYRRGAVSEVPSAVDVVTIDGRPAIASVMPLLSSSNYRLQEPGTEFLHISILFLDAELAQQLSEQYLLADAGFSLDQSTDLDHAVYPIMNSQNRFVAFLEWRQDKPGTRVLSETVPVLAVGFLIAGIVVLLLLDKLWRSSRALENGRRQAQHQASHDMLTGLPNRAMFDQSLGQVLADLPPGRGSVALFILDLDRFKYVNDTRGHQAGDALIQAVARRLNALVSAPNLICRIGGDEFALISHRCPSEAEARTMANAMISVIDRPFEIAGGDVYIGVSIGIAMTSDVGSDRNELVRKADIALYEAKAGGRNRAVIYQDAMNEELQFRSRIEGELREALKSDDQLSVVFQPVFNRTTGKPSGAEALSRWRHPELGFVSPVHFIPVAESSGLIEILGERVLLKACQMGARWPGMTIAVNISPSQLRNPTFAGKVFAMLEETGMRAQDLELEITENILLEDDQITNDTLRIFRLAGIKIALDDFGTGYSSLNYLKRYAVDRIKIDRSFISQLGDADGVSSAIVQAMVTLAHAMRIEVTAEGVETIVQHQVLVTMGCNKFQGYYFSPPVSRDKVEDMFALAGAIPARAKAS